MSKKTVLPGTAFDIAARNRLLIPSSFIIQNFAGNSAHDLGAMTQLILSYPGRPNICDQLYPEDRERPASYADRLKQKIDEILKSTSAVLARENTAYIPFTSGLMGGGITYQAHLTPRSVRFTRSHRDGTFSVYPTALNSEIATKDAAVIKSFSAGLGHQTNPHDWIEFRTNSGETVTCQKAQIVDIESAKDNKLKVHFDGGDPEHDVIISFDVTDAKNLAALLKESLGLESSGITNSRAPIPA